MLRAQALHSMFINTPAEKILGFSGLKSQNSWHELTCYGSELNSNEWLQIVGGVLEWEIFSEEALFTVQTLVWSAVAKIFDVSWIFTFAWNPNNLQVFFATTFDVLSQTWRHLDWQFLALCVIFGLPVEDLIELEEDAWLALGVAKVVPSSARLESIQINSARLFIGWAFSSAINSAFAVRESYKQSKTLL